MADVSVLNKLLRSGNIDFLTSGNFPSVDVGDVDFPCKRSDRFIGDVDEVGKVGELARLSEFGNF